MTVAQTILAQLGGNRFLAMTGAKGLLDHNGALSMKLSPSMTRERGNYLKITLNGNDLYDIEYAKYSPRSLTVTPLRTMSDVGVENLRQVFTSLTGLDTHL